MAFKLDHKKTLIILAVPGILFLSYLFYPRADNRVEGEEATLINSKRPLVKEHIKLKDEFFYQENYNKALTSVSSVKKKDNITSVIVPHHLLASDLIARQINEAGGRDIKLVVVIGPNHNNIGGDALSSIKADWETPFGILRHESELVDKFITDFKIQSDAVVFENEHSIGGIVPFIRDLLGDVEFMPIIVSSYADHNGLIKLSDWLDDNLGNDSLIIYSIDFSHYLTKEEADKNDNITRELMLNKDIYAVLGLDNDYVDSPFTLALSLEIAKNNGLEIMINENANSYDYSQVKPVETTSYFTVSFRSTKSPY